MNVTLDCALAADGTETTVTVAENAPYAAFVWKTIADPFAGRITMLRVVNGALKSDASVSNLTHDTTERLGHLLVLQGKTQTHVPEVVANGGYARGTRFELYSQFAHPDPGCPRFCAIYEADAAATEGRQTRGASRRTLSSGPPTWENHDTVWRLVYRRIPLPA